ncbi:MAG: PilZ domain-containing protein [Spirochaetia bacterium]|nr:PilZ domain-containing protein [Spirochaetia bacterium]
MSTEKRKAARFAISQFINISYTKENFIKATGINISIAGMLCELDGTVEPYSKIFILLDLQDKKDPVELEGIIVRIEKKGQKYLAGVEFSDIYDEDKERLKKFIKTL